MTKKELTSDRDICYVFALKRSGHHAIINWLMPYLGVNVKHRNNCIVLDNGKYFINGNDNFEYVYNDNYSWSRLINFEDVDLSCLDKLPSCPTRILILRDPYNNYASRIKRTKVNRNFGNYKYERWIDFNLWIQFANEFLNYTKHLGDNVIKINYNEWFSNHQYRIKLGKYICSVFNTTYFDNAINKVPKIGEGSSFDDYKFDGKAQRMNVLSRWRSMLYDRDFLPIMRNEEIRNLSQIIFKRKIVKNIKLL